MIPQRYIDLAQAATPQELHAAVLRLSLDRVWDQPWMVYSLGNIPSTRELLVRMDLPYHLEWPRTRCLGEGFGTRSRDTGTYSIPLAVIIPAEPVPVELMWRLAITSGQPVLSYPEGMVSSGMLIPPDTSPSRVIDPGPESIAEAYGGIVACVGSLDSMQLTLMRDLHPVQIPGFPKFWWETQNDAPGFQVKGRSVL